jgi:tetratricopeptide (TPR) repeat protein
MLKAQMARYQGQRTDAIRLMREATELSPRADYLRELASVAHEAADHVTAFEVASRAFAMEPHLTAALIGAVNGTYAARFAEALQLADRVHEMSPDDRNAHVIRAACLTDLARYDEAIAAADVALAMDHEPMVENMKAYALAAAGRDAEARAAYEHALGDLDAAMADASDAKADLHSRRAWSLLGLGRAKEALAAAKEALKLEKEAFLAMQSEGRALVALGKPKEALVVLERAIRSRHAAPMASFHAAEAYAALGDEAAAAQAIRAACASPHFERAARASPALAKLVDDPRGAEPARTKSAPTTATKAKASTKRKAKAK